MTNSAATNSKRRFIGMFSLCEVESSAERLILSAESAYRARLLGVVRDVGVTLINSGISPLYTSIGLYYIGRSELTTGIGDIEQAVLTLERAKHHAPLNYQERISLAQSMGDFYQGDIDARARACERLMKATDIYARLEATRGLAVIYGLQGKHEKAINILESATPIPGTLSYYDWHNSQAVEYRAAGKNEQAREVIEIVKSSPYLSRYSEWQETISDIEKEAQITPLVSVAGPRTSDNVRDLVPLKVQRQRSVKALINQPSPEMVRGVYRVVQRFE